MTSKTLSNTKNSPLLNQIDEGINFDSNDWNKNTFHTLTTSNLSPKTIFYYAIDVGFRRLENSLYESYWDETADALHDLTQFLFSQSSDNDTDGYLYEAKCQLLMYSAIAIIKMNTIRRRSIHDAKMACATLFLLLLERSKSYELPSIVNESSSCTRSMHRRYLKRIFIIVQSLSTLSKIQLNDMQTNFERYTVLLVNQLYPTDHLQEKINNFIDKNLFGNNLDDDSASSDFVFIRQFPIFNEDSIDKYNDLMNMCLVSTFDQFKTNFARKLICYIWTLCCMIESNRVSLGMIRCSAICEHFSQASIDFEQKPIQSESLNELDVIVFLLLCAQQNVHIHVGDSTLHPYLLFSLSHLCTHQQKRWWQTAMEKTQWNEFNDHLATIRLYDERTFQHPPMFVILETALILLKSAQHLYEQCAKRVASSYEQYGLRYLQVAKRSPHNQRLSDSLNRTITHGNKQDKLFFFYSQKTTGTEQSKIEELIEKCEKLVQKCDELKLLPEQEPPRTSSPTEEQQQDINISAALSPVAVEKTERKNLEITDSTLFATPPTHKATRDVDVQTFIQSPSPSPPPPIVPVVPIEETIETSEPPLPAYVNMIFSHMNGVNQWINRFCLDSEIIQNDINIIRDRLEKINRVTTQMMFSNMKVSPSETSENSGGFYSSSHHG
ncbi:unnamed protein product [Rotaria socialis]|uniref:Uncharacterized protein n=1 Tax=Rotaria socialis TaxID=392032 RepID=A0A817XHA1_9BILA|nr:unnamed protein product [Rotaria socialis]CAF4130469.1 unnamed protein product [Rotaria socialis]